MKKVLSLIFILTLVIGVSRAEAWTLRSICHNIIKALQKDEKPAQEWQRPELTGEEFGELGQAYERYLDYKARVFEEDYKGKAPESPGEIHEFHGRKYKLLNFLGRGGEGYVYLIQDIHSNEILTVKIFRSSWVARSNLSWLKHFRKLGLPVAQVHTSKWFKRPVLFQFIPGIPVNLFVSNDPQPIDFSKSLREKVRAYFRHLQDNSEQYISPFNTLIDINSGRLIIIDTQ